MQALDHLGTILAGHPQRQGVANVVYQDHSAPGIPVAFHEACQVLMSLRGYPGCNYCLVTSYVLFAIAYAIRFPLFFRGWPLGSAITNMA